MSKAKVDVKIFGQNYTVTGEKDPSEIIQIAEYVESKIRFISNITSEFDRVRIVILAAINIAEEYFKALADVKKLKTEKKELEQEVQKYMNQVEEQKEDFVSYQQDVRKANDEKKDQDVKYEELEKKFGEVESAYFELQMENIKLKSQIKKLEMGQRE